MMISEDATKSRKGGFGTTTRVQPRSQQGKQQQFDDLVKQRLQQEMELQKDKTKSADLWDQYKQDKHSKKRIRKSNFGSIIQMTEDLSSVIT